MSFLRARPLWPLKAVMALGLFAWLSTFGAPQALAEPLPDFAQFKRQQPSSEWQLKDRAGILLHQERRDLNKRQLAWTSLEAMSPVLRAALVMTEDQRFYEHAGVDWTAVASASFRNLLNNQTRGASTLTMQLAGFIEPELKRGASGRSWSAKWRQAWVAERLERTWSKDQILEAYLNVVTLRGDLVGVGTASRVFFDRLPQGLDASQAALLVALVRGPNAAPDTVSARACAVVRKLQRGDCEEVRRLAATVLERRAEDLQYGWGSAPLLRDYAARHVLLQLTPSATPGQQVMRSTIDARIQRMAVASLDRQLALLNAQRVEDGAVVVLDNASGEVLAWVGSSLQFSRAPLVDHVRALRQAGSTLKPFIYAIGLEQRQWTAASVLMDEPLSLNAGGGQYAPGNYDHHYRGPVTVREALAGSLNVPAVKAINMIAPDALYARMKALGFTALEGSSGQHYGASLALGSADVNLIALTNAYRALANGGQFTPWSLQFAGHGRAPARGAAPATQVFGEASAFIVSDILADRNARALTFGLHSVLATAGYAAVKTGTSKDMRDNWCIGFTDRYTVGVWVGNSEGSAMRDVSGVVGAAPVWADLVAALHAEEASVPPRHGPVGVERVAVQWLPAINAPRQEWFIEGTVQTLVPVPSLAQDSVRLEAPSAETIFALDPDIPPQAQRVQFRAQGREANRVHWRLNGILLGAGAQWHWMPMPGRHTLEMLVGAQVIDRVRFEVRGARIKGGRPAQGVRGYN